VKTSETLLAPRAPVDGPGPLGEIPPGSAARRRAGHAVRAMAVIVPMLWALAAVASASPDSRILFARDTPVPPPVQAFAWRVIETRCNYQAFEREQRSFWAYDAQARRVDAGVVYSINVLSDLGWKKSEPPAAIAMTVVDDGGIRLTALTSTFVVCTPGAR